MTITTQPVPTLSHTQVMSALGTIVGSAAGDALGAPFEFEPGGLYRATFPHRVLGGSGEMVGGGSFAWGRGEFTDDTQMALALAESLLAAGREFDPQTTWEHFVAWTRGATDIGNTTRRSLAGADWRTAAKAAHDRAGHSAGNGSVMRIAPVGVAGVRWGAERTVQVAQEQSGLTHFEPSAGWGAALVAELIRRLIIVSEYMVPPNEAFVMSLDGLLGAVGPEATAHYAPLLADGWTPDDAQHGNGTVWTCIAQAVWAVRTTSSFEEAVTTAVNLGDDADTVAAVTGAIAGALYGVQRIPSRWATYLHGYVRQPDGTTREYRMRDLNEITHALIGKRARPETPPEPPIAPSRLHDDGVYACNLAGAELAGTDMAIVSLCRTGARFDDHPYKREIYIIDDDNRNPGLHDVVTDAVEAVDAFLAEGRNVVIHCHGGRSRTGLILKAWYMRRHGVDHAVAHEWVRDIWPHYATWNDDFFTFLDNDWSH